MTNMLTDFVGLKMKNPFIIAAGPWNRDGSSTKKGLLAGAGAVITETIVSDAMLDVRPRIAYNGFGAQNIRLYSDIQVEGWEHEMDIAKSAGGIVIASVSAHTPSELAYLASKMEKFGADAIEISVSNPAKEGLEVLASNPDVIFDMTREVVSNVRIPVIVKLSQNSTNISRVAKAVQKAGGSAVSAINSVRCILGVDIEKAEPSLPTYGGYSGVPIRPLGLASVATIAQTSDIPICGVGGIDNFRNAVEYMMLGASAVQVGTAVMIHGFERITEMVEQLEEWCDSHGISDVQEIRGKALKNLKSFDEMKIEPAISISDGRPCREGCNECVRSCVYNAIEKTGNEVKAIGDRCTGCGLCTSLCPIKKLHMKW
ncbi:MAG: hypothetical protein K6F52_07310 [Clostridia bacterium]|nr:hypothetical protein [Clostridia bacterium]